MQLRVSRKHVPDATNEYRMFFTNSALKPMPSLPPLRHGYSPPPRASSAASIKDCREFSPPLPAAPALPAPPPAWSPATPPVPALGVLGSLGSSGAGETSPAVGAFGVAGAAASCALLAGEVGLLPFALAPPAGPDGAASACGSRCAASLTVFLAASAVSSVSALTRRPEPLAPLGFQLPAFVLSSSAPGCLRGDRSSVHPTHNTARHDQRTVRRLSIKMRTLGVEQFAPISWGVSLFSCGALARSERPGDQNALLQHDPFA